MNKRGFLQISFGWLFALIIGGFVLFLAIYFVVEFTKTSDVSQGALSSKDIGILLNPLETGFESGKKTFLELPQDTRIINGCFISGTFGRQTISTSQKRLGKWSDPSFEATFENKYIFSDEVIEGRDFVLFAKPFVMPFKISDLIYIIPKDKKYCFVDAPGEILNEADDLKLNVVNASLSNCPEESESVCFQGGNCDIRVAIINGQPGRVTKNGKDMIFEGNALMYAAIFGNPEIYECQVKRLVMKQEQLALLYNEKSFLVARSGCDSNLPLVRLANMSDSYVDSGTSLRGILNFAENIERSNARATCKLW